MQDVIEKRDKMASAILEMSDSDLKTLDDLIKSVTAKIEGQNWTDSPLTDEEVNLISMAVMATFHEVKRSDR